MARGKDDFADAYIDEKISISDYPLSASVACGKVRISVVPLLWESADVWAVLLCARRTLGHCLNSYPQNVNDFLFNPFGYIVLLIKVRPRSLAVPMYPYQVQPSALQLADPPCTISAPRIILHTYYIHRTVHNSYLLEYPFLSAFPSTSTTAVQHTATQLAEPCIFLLAGLVFIRLFCNKT